MTNIKPYENGFNAEYVIATDSRNFCINLMVSAVDLPPKQTNPDLYDFFVHVKYDAKTLNDDIMLILERAANIMKRKGEKSPDSETDTYKIRINTSKVIEDTNVYIRDEKKDRMSYMSIAGMLSRILTKIIDDLNEMDEMEEEENDEISMDD